MLLIAVLACGACKKRVKVPPPPPASDAALAIDAAPPIDAAAPIDAWLDPRTERMRTYVDLLAIDFWLYELFESFPGAPTSGTFIALDYDWNVDDLLAADALRAQVDRALQASTRTPHTATDDAVHAYVSALAADLPALLALREYYAGQRFIDDEFDRARREAPDIARLRGHLAALRPAMRRAIFTAWRELSAEVTDSPRAIVTIAWRKCITVADALMAHAKPAVLEAAMSACRRSIPRERPRSDGSHRGQPLCCSSSR